ncbi:ABC-2 transporter permease [Clostridium lundense]|uniref:ABC-2 transporter permease n=1 Tax=Clostridium lundense TaxID=319475 RepID=UPI000480C5E8
MFNLILKDFLLQKKITLFTIAYALVFNLTCYLSSSNLDKLEILPIFGIVFFTYLSIFYMIGIEERNKSLVIINSLPLERSQIVISKYISLIFFTIVNALTLYLPTFIFGIIFRNNQIYSLNYSILTVFIALLLILFSIYYPLYFKYGYNSMRVFSFIFYILMFSIPGFLQKLMKNSNIFHKFVQYTLTNPQKTLLILFTLALSIFIISLYFSIAIYKNKDL